MKIAKKTSTAFLIFWKGELIIKTPFGPEVGKVGNTGLVAVTLLYAKF